MRVLTRDAAALKLVMGFISLVIAVCPAGAEPSRAGLADHYAEPRPERFARPIGLAISGPMPVKVKAQNIGNPSDRGKVESVIADHGRPARQDLLDGVPFDLQQLVPLIASEEQVDVNLILSVMRVENPAFDRFAVSGAGAVGLMQVKPATGIHYGAQDLTDPEQNIRAGARFLADLVRKYVNPVLVAAAYNAGEPRVDMSASIPLIPETADYVTKVVGLLTVGPRSGTERIAFGGAARSAYARGGSRKARKAASSMLVYSADVAERTQVSEIAGEMTGSGPVRIRKEQ